MSYWHWTEPWLRSAAIWLTSTMNPQRMRLLAVLMVVLALSSYGGWTLLRGPGIDQLPAAQQLFDEEQFEAAEKLAAEIAVSHPESCEALLLAAYSAGSQKQFERAVGYLDRVVETESDCWLQSRVSLARYHHHGLNRLGAALEHYSTVLAKEPDHPEANLGMARILATCAREQDAVPFILRLIRTGNEQKLAQLLLREGSIIENPELLEKAQRAASEDPNPLIGLAWHQQEAKQYERAIDLLKQATERAPEMGAAWSALGKAYLKAERYDELAKWVSVAPPSTWEYATAWVVRADVARRSDDEEGVTRCLLEASSINPQSVTLHQQLAQQLPRIAAPGLSRDLQARYQEHFDRLREIRDLTNRLFSAGRPPSPEEFERFTELLVQSGRHWEALSWERAIAGMEPLPPERTARWQQLEARCESLAFVQTLPSLNPAMQIDREQFAIRAPAIATQQVATKESLNLNLRFEDQAAASGLHFQYRAGHPAESRMRMYEFTGGGIGVLDYDRDGYPDVYCTQGGRDFDHPPYADVDGLFRNQAGTKFTNIASAAGVHEDRFGQGVACGDFNSDGFPDVYVANIRANRLWLNNGDGTFSDVTTEAGLGGQDWTTSCLMADLNADGHPDIYDVNYVTAPDVFERLCANPDGSPSMCAPIDFPGTVDAVWLSQADGTFRLATEEMLNVTPNGKGLGIAAWSTDDTGRLSVFVANDTVPSFFFVPDSSPGATMRLRESALPAGVAVNRDGKATACMGIAVTDLNHDGWQDFMVTNFLDEPNTLYRAIDQQLYEDTTRDAGLYRPTWDMLAFGTQFLDANLDGEAELFVANGHMEDLSRLGTPYRMRPQLFAWNKSQFEELRGDGLGEYFAGEYLGRSVARIDWNRDGRQDLLVGHLDAPIALLTNSTVTHGNALVVHLVGTKSSRDAYGTRVNVKVGDVGRHYQLVAGSGYQANNEPTIIVGCGSADLAEITISWPGGTTQVFREVRVPAEIVITEGSTQPGFALRLPLR